MFELLVVKELKLKKKLKHVYSNIVYTQKWWNFKKHVK